MEKEEENQTFYVNQILVNPQHNELCMDEQCVRIQPKVMAVLCFLSTHSERVISNEELIENVWEGRVVTHGSVQKSINALRSALAELDPGTEYVTHFSKRGYQLVQSISNVNSSSPPEKKHFSAYSRWAVSLTVFLLVVSVVFVTVVSNQKEPEVLDKDSPASEVDNALVESQETVNKPEKSIKPVTFKQVALEVEVEEGARLPAPHPKGRGLAFVKTEADDLGVQNHIMIQNFNGQAWVLADSQEDWVALEWSPSGRNLVALERWSVEDDFSSSYFYKMPIHFYTFHIFTLDFKGEKLIEKNRLSQWHGRVSSVTWWDENTLEFVASQGTQVSLDRYRYQIPDQNLSLLTPTSDGVEPLASSVHNKSTALITRNNHGAHLEILSEDGLVDHTQPLDFLPTGLSWAPNGEGVIVFNAELDRRYFYHVDGIKQSISFDISPAEKINHLAFGHQAKTIWAELAQNESSVWLFWSKAGSVDVTMPLPDYRSGTFTQNGAVLFARTDLEGKKTLELMTMSERKTLDFSQEISGIQKAFESENENQINIFSDSGLWVFNYKDETLQKIAEVEEGFNPYFYHRAANNLWGVKAVDNTRNVFIANLDNGQTRPITFGSISSVVAGNDQLYFQYTDQLGLWKIDYQSQQIEKVDNTLPANVKLLAVGPQSVFYFKGHKCHESGVYALSLLDAQHSLVQSRASHALDTLAYHPSGLFLARKCSAQNSKTTKFAR